MEALRAAVRQEVRAALPPETSGGSANLTVGNSATILGSGATTAGKGPPTG